jgi:hypothetical protein
MTHNLKEDDQSFILTIYVKGLWSLFFFNFRNLKFKKTDFLNKSMILKASGGLRRETAYARF